MKNTGVAVHVLSAFLVLLAAVSCKNGNGVVTASGTFETDEVTVSSEVSGKLLSLSVMEGAEVRAAEVLGQVDSVSLYLTKLQLEQEIAALESSRPDTAAQLAVMRVQLENARHELNRLSRLLESDAATRKQFDDTEASVAVLEKQILSTESSLRRSLAGIEARIAGLKIQVEQTDDMLSRCRITSPVDGTVLSRYAHAGEMAAAGKPLFKVADLRHMFLRAYFTSGQLKDVSLGQDVIVTADFGGGNVREYPGKVAWISAKSEFTPKSIQTDNDRENLVYAVKIAVENDGYIKIGMFGKVSIQ